MYIKSNWTLITGRYYDWEMIIDTDSLPPKGGRQLCLARKNHTVFNGTFEIINTVTMFLLVYGSLKFRCACQPFLELANDITGVGLTSGDEGSGLDTEQVVLIAAVGGALILIAVVFIVVLATVCAYRKRGNYYYGSRRDYRRRARDA